MFSQVRAALLMLVTMTLLTGVAYPLAVTGLAHVAFPSQANGSLLENARGQVIGSSLVGQDFTGDGYFHGRPSAAGAGYDAANSGGSNLGPTSAKLIGEIRERAEALGATGDAPAPVDLVTASASGLDPDISPEAALFQVQRVAHARSLPEPSVRTLVINYVTGRALGLLGEPRVNVLSLNLALDRLAAAGG